MLDETSPFIAAWFMAMILMTMMMKVTYSPWTSEIHLASYRHLVSNMKPCITLCTGIFSCSVHCYVHNMWREDNVFVLGCVIMLSLGLSIVEIFWSMQVNKLSVAKATHKCPFFIKTPQKLKSFIIKPSSLLDSWTIVVSPQEMSHYKYTYNQN